ncbi:MAG: head-tail adaptor protein [Paracoccaceae bacterium]
MRRPRLNRALTLETPQAVSDGMGGLSEGWTPLGTLWAEVRARSGRVTDGEAGALSRSSMRITVRAAAMGAPDRPQAGQRLRSGARVFLIDAVTEYDATGRYLTCFAREEVAA